MKNLQTPCTQECIINNSGIEIDQATGRGEQCLSESEFCKPRLSESIGDVVKIGHIIQIFKNIF